MATRSRSLKVQGAKYQNTVLGVPLMTGVGFFLQKESLDSFFQRLCRLCEAQAVSIFPSALVTLLASGSLAFGSQGGCLAPAITLSHHSIQRWKTAVAFSGLSLSGRVQHSPRCGQGAGQVGSVPCVWPFLPPPACGGRRWDLQQVLGLPRSGACFPASGCSRHSVLLC